MQSQRSVLAVSVATLFLIGSAGAAVPVPPAGSASSSVILSVVEGSPAPETADREDEEFLTDEEAEERDDLDGEIGREDIGEEEADEDEDDEESEENGGGQQHAFEHDDDDEEDD
ncbi:MAG: hypothetical protein JJU06_19760 [Ectothiorhodospiraceae bacterium]|nr:hypothetical protein [Ectothiorhodospiraceae bacterium]